MDRQTNNPKHNAFSPIYKMGKDVVSKRLYSAARSNPVIETIISDFRQRSFSVAAPKALKGTDKVAL